VLFVIAVLLAVFWLPDEIGWVVVGVAARLELGESYFWYRWSQRRRAHTGGEAMIGRKATAIGACRPRGQVKLDGEIWQAICPEGADPGETVTIESLDGLTLTVRRASSRDAA
jgi:membrane protein implicated in regulation of membrane protease activity